MTLGYGDLETARKRDYAGVQERLANELDNQYQSGAISKRTYDSAQPSPDRQSFARSVQPGNQPSPNPRQPAVRQKAQQGVVPAPPAPTANRTAVFLTAAKDSLLRIFAPSARGTASRDASYTIREHNAELARRDEVVQKALAGARTFFAGRQFSDNVDFMDRMERGVAQGDASLDAIARQFRTLLETARNEIQQLGTGKLEGYYQHYFPHIWKDPKKAADWLRTLIGKKPLEGPKSFLKQRTIATIKDGLNAGLEPVSGNPADLVVLKLHEMHRYLLMHRMMDQLNAEGKTTYVPATQRAADGLTRIDDNIATVWGKPTVTVHESFDAPLMRDWRTSRGPLAFRTSDWSN